MPCCSEASCLASHGMTASCRPIRLEPINPSLPSAAAESGECIPCKPPHTRGAHVMFMTSRSHSAHTFPWRRIAGNSSVFHCTPGTKGRPATPRRAFTRSSRGMESMYRWHCNALERQQCNTTYYSHYINVPGANNRTGHWSPSDRSDRSSQETSRHQQCLLGLDIMAA